MKKYGRKWRKLQKEKEMRKANVKIGEPYSKSRLKKKLCLHYGGRPGGILPGYCYSFLHPINDKECICSVCRKTFSIKKYGQMQKLVAYLSNKGCVTDTSYIAKLSRGLEPVYYRRLSETEVEIIETVEDGIIMPRHICII